MRWLPVLRRHVQNKRAHNSQIHSSLFLSVILSLNWNVYPVLSLNIDSPESITSLRLLTIPLDLSGFSVLTEMHPQLSWVSSLQVAEHGASQSPEFHNPIPTTNLLLYT